AARSGRRAWLLVGRPGPLLLAVGVGAWLARPRCERRGRGAALVLLVLVLLRFLLFLVASHLTLGHGEPPALAVSGLVYMIGARIEAPAAGFKRAPPCPARRGDR